MATFLDNTVIRNSNQADLAKFLRAALTRTDSGSISGHLLSAVATESIPPRVFSVWLYVCHDSGPLVDALSQAHSKLVRKVAIKSFGKWLRTPRLDEAWSAAGGTEGLLLLLSRMSVSEVKLFCRFVGGTATSQTATTERRRRVSELLESLAHDSFANSRLQNPDRRPLLRHYSLLLPAASEETVLTWTSNKSLPTVETDKLIRAHPNTYRTDYFKSMRSEKRREQPYSKYRPLLQYVPPLPANVPGLSASMHFSILVLRYLVTDRETWFDGHQLYRELILPLVRRLWRRKGSPSACAEILDLVDACLERYKDLANRLTLRSKDLFYYLTRLWSRNPTHIGHSLVALLRMMPEEAFGNSALREVSPLLECVKHSLRMPFLKLFLRHHRSFQMDIDNDEDLKADKHSWPASLLLALQRKDALVLLQRLIRLRPATGFLEYHRLATGQTILHFDHRDDPTILLLLLSSSQSDNFHQAEAAILERKKKAITSRDQEDRAYWAKSVLLCAIASQSLDLFADTLIWARRYNRDALTVKALYNGSVVTTEAIGLLCGFPERPLISKYTAEDIKNGVSKGNNICKLIFETASMALREPSFALFDWKAVLGLFRHVVEIRATRFPQLQEALCLSDDDAYDLVWKTTIDTCLALEEAGLEGGREKLACNTQGGVLELVYGLKITLLRPRPAMLKFIDNLARRRNELWERFRPTVHPAVAALPKPWPRGLPVQRLLPFLFTPESEYFRLPYISARNEGIVFSDPSDAITPAPDSDEIKVAVGCFVDDYKSALRFYVIECLDGPPRADRVTQAWFHALQNLTGARMSSSEAVHFWKKVFYEAGIEPPPNAMDESDLFRLPEVSIPAVHDPSEPTEWNPDPASGLNPVRSRPLNAVVLDWMLVRNDNPRSTIDPTLLIPQPATVEAQQRNIWAWLLRTIPPECKDGLIAAALLFLDARRCGATRILMDSFPNAEDPRFPPLFLDPDFLDREDHEEHRAVKALKVLNGDVPSALLVQLVTAMLAAAKEQKNPWSSESIAFALIKLLVDGDRPQTALELIQELVLDRPADSSWHRNVLTVGLLNGLSAYNARDFLQSFSTKLQAKLAGQVQQAPSIAATGSQANSQPAVKVTTVKMLAQIMSNADFVDQTFATQVLVELFASAKHLDIRVAIIQSLTQMLTDARDPVLEANIFEALERQTIGIAASMNERQPMTEQDWEQARSKGVLPEVYETSNSQSLPPVLTALVTASRRLYGAGKNILHKMLCERILLPVLQLSAWNNRLWTTIFLQKIGFHIDLDRMPAVPAKPLLLAKLIRDEIEVVPGSVLDVYVEFVITNLQRPEAFAKVNEMILGDASLRSSNEGKHWLSLWNNNGFQALGYGGFTVASLLKRVWASLVQDGVSHPQVQRQWLRQADILISRGSILARERDYHLHELHPRPRSIESSQKLWYNNCRPLVEEMIKRIDRLRTPEWNHQPKRQPDILPDTFGMRLWMMTYPMPWRADRSEQCQLFVFETISIIDELSSSGRPYHDRFQQLKNTVMGIYETEYVAVAVKLGSSAHIEGPEGNVADWLRIEIADALLLSASDPDDDLVIQQAKTMVASWQSSPIEDVRMRGMRTFKALTEPTNKVKAWFREQGK